MRKVKLTDQEIIRRLRHPVSMAELHSVQQYIIDAPEFKKKAKAIWKKKGLDREDFRSYYLESMQKLFDKIRQGLELEKKSVIAYFLGIFKKDVLHALRELGRKKRIKTQSLDEESKITNAPDDDTLNWEEQKIKDEENGRLLDFIQEFSDSDCVRLLMMQLDQANNQEILDAFGWKSDQIIHNKRSECLKKLKNAAKDNPNLKDDFKY
jgi:DNA-directed RNA polymerase specialized sigma24 family protein